ncbi:hypothetical protein N7540_011551 [Penicillium herquei]|nr:hypothetical protein N7540_011551 [Penicillium herquei]
MGPKGEHSGHSRWKFPSRFKRSEKHNKTKLEPDRSEYPENIASSDDPWTDAFDQLSPELQANLRARGMDEKRTASMRDQVDKFKQEAGRLQESSKGKDWKFSLKGQEILARDLTTRIVGWAIKIGDIAIPFASATSVAAAAWGCATLFLKGIQDFDTEKRALLSIAEQVAQAMFLGQLYSNIYTRQRTGNYDVIANLRKATVDLYICVLTLLAKSLELTSNTVAQFCRSLFEDQLRKPSGILSDLASRKSALNEAAGLCEVTAKALQDQEFKKLLQATELFQRQYFQTINENEQREIRDWVSNVPYTSHRWEIEESRNKKTVVLICGAMAPRIPWDGIACTGSGFAYFFCNRDEDDRRRSSPVLRSLVRQLATTSSIDKSIRGSLQKLWRKSEKDGFRLDFGRSDCQNQLFESFNTYPITFVVLDALDEVNKEDLRILLKDIRDIMSKTENTVKLFVASRPEVGVPHRMWPTITIQARDNFEDIKKYVEGEIEQFIDDYRRESLDQGSELVSAVEEKKDKIIQDVLDKCDNMFLWAALQVKRILVDCHTVEAIENVLKILPMGLDKAYDRIFEDIKRFPDPDQEIVEHTLKWVYAAPGLLHTEEILSAIRVRVKDGSLTFTHAVNKETLLSMCRNLLIVDSEEQWRFCHLSAREYLDNKVESTGNFSETRSLCAEICFRTLLLSFNSQHTVFNQSNTEHKNHHRFKIPFHPANPFSRHCQLYWPFYAKTKAANNSNVLLLEQFLGFANEASSFYLGWFDYALKFNSKRDAGTNAAFVSDYETTFTKSFYHDEKLPEAPIFLVAYLALYEPLRDWCENSDMSPIQSNKHGDYLLTIAITSRCMPLCKTLILRGKSFDKKKFQLCLSQALVAAADQGDISMVKYLIGQGANVNLPPEPKGNVKYYSGPVGAAARRGNLDLVRYLVEEANAVVGDALFWAAQPESKETGLDIIKFLIENHKADPNFKPIRHRYASALVVATVFCRRDMIRYYLEETNADVNAVYSRTGSYGSPLCAMICNGSLEDVRYFVEKGKANVNLLHEFVGCGSALSYAASLGKLEIVKYFVEEAGAKTDLQLKVGDYGSALTAALVTVTRNKDCGTFNYLAPHSQVNLPLLCGNYGSALAAAFVLPSSDAKVNMDIVRHLIEAGADVNMRHQVGKYGSPFVTAAFFVTDLDIIHYLVDRCKADLNALHSTGNYGSALAAAANGGNLPVVKYLVDSGVDFDCEIQVGTYGSALAAAAAGWNLNLAVVKYLVDLGVDTNRELKYGAYGSALVAAAATNQLNGVRYLVEKGNADVDLCLRSGSFGSALAAAAAAANGKLEEVEYLVEKGKANVDLLLVSGSFGSALLAAIISPFDFPIDQEIIRTFWNPRLDIDLAIQILGDNVGRVILSTIFAPPWLRENAFGVVKYLMNAGANVDLELQVGAYGNALTASVAIGNLDQVKYLVREGNANANFQLNTGSFGSALVVAIIADSKLRKLRSLYPAAIHSIQQIISVQFDLMDPHYRPSESMTATVARSKVDSMMISLADIMVYLLESGADVNLQLNVGPFGSALAAAAAMGSFWHVKFLVKKAKADVNLQLKNGSYANAYEAAIAHGYHDIAAYLAQKGKDTQVVNVVYPKARMPNQWL